ncbi:thiamine-phosphate kinase [Brooklawnia cerclae]|uniref:Thiamine-monophosphate kinase n=1 Tax=Brooklawnia cerclae TaxID=349934 RepID=A0ABX0SIV4_9ACTN|nr:thiamine-phosphate kinase [Brooklawnia cerclae]NIH57000.1 thiamine-monophosphate kinase [Brooklawnia cerclae]
MTTSGAGPQTIRDIGEFGLISQVTRRLELPPAVSVGPGDDGAVFLVNGSSVTSVDMLVENVHFRRSWSSAADVGHKSVAVNVADLEAMGASPVAMVIGFGAPPDLPVSWVKEFMTGVREEADLAGVALVGGDMTGARDITVCVTVIGETGGRTPVLRSGAEPGQVVAVKGRLGWAAAGLAALGRGFRSPRAAVDSQRTPKVPYGAGKEAALAGATAMIDVSDGLLADLGHIADASEVGIALDSERFDVADPVRAVATAINKDPLGFVLTGGEDHALAATFAPDDVPDDWQVVGRVVDPDPDEGPCVLVDGRHWEGDPGWTHFSAL